MPTDLVQVELVGAAEDGVPQVVTCTPGDAGTVVVGEGGDLPRQDSTVLAQLGFTADAGATKVVALPGADTDHFWLLGTGDADERAWRTAGARLVRAVDDRLARTGSAGHGAALQLWLPPTVDPQQVSALVTGLVLGSHQLRVTGSDHGPRLGSVALITTATYELRDAVRLGSVLGRATALARDLAGMPSDVKSPQWLAETAERACTEVSGLQAIVRDERWLADNGFGGVLAVGGGSSRPPRLLELSWQPAGATTHVVLVGKGITFDTGGISIKPAEGMHLMKTDMSGGAAVIAALRAVAELELPIRVSGLVPCAENHVSGSAYRPGDVVTHYGGRTTEVSNTDAEGRMVLADALAYAVDTLSPDAMVDVATLTGAMKVALGLRTGGLFATTDELAQQISTAGARVGEQWWRMPLLADHAEAVVSDIADLRQGPPGPGGITAALFLREFTAGLPWAHLDIAGPARAEQGYDEVAPVATGFAARTLVELVRAMAPTASRPRLLQTSPR
ncbi:leucyl aminopeptidase family protein [Rhodococcus sp. X156]|uniref:leucyl aminopeptidase family protein n=1 Tax=Rhodococcus sp. X156 TaxID=2499145 RepID=UPI001F497667|nr:leucyl aminopeptidase family protein [Rhodococcus sp. X156]